MKTLLLIVFFLVIESFFGALIVPNWLTTILLFCCLAVGYKIPTIYSTSFRMIFWGLVGSTVSCYIFRGQNPVETFQTLTYYYGILFYFYLKKSRFNLNQVEHALVILIIVFDIAYIIQYYLIDYGINFLNIDDWMLGESAIGGNRLRVQGSALYNIGIFLGIVKYNKTKKIVFIIIAMLGLYVMLLSGFRQLIVSFALVMVFYMYKNVRWGKVKIKHVLMFLVLLIMVFFMIQQPAIQEKIVGMAARSEDGQNFGNDDYVRMVQLYFYTHDFFKSPIEALLGAGIPRKETAYMKWFEDQPTFVDWGLIGQAWVLGPLTVLGFVLFSWKAIKTKVALQYKYISLWYIFLLLSSITNYEFVRNGNFVVHAIALYIVEVAGILNIKEKTSNTNNNVLISNNTFVQ